MHGYFPTGQSVKETLAGLGLDLRDAQFIDEPPGKLKNYVLISKRQFPDIKKLKYR